LAHEDGMVLTFIFTKLIHKFVYQVGNNKKVIL